MHLSYSTSKYKGKSYKSYSIAESYRDGQKVRKRTIWPIGKLTDEQVQQIKLICQITKSSHQVVSRITDLVVKEAKSYMDIALANELWRFWQLDNAFEIDTTAGQFPTCLVAKILTINRCIDPCSHYSIPNWISQTAIKEVLGVDLANLNDDEIYYELDKIYYNKAAIENYLFSQTVHHNAGAYRYINYDLTTSYFVGYKCSLSAFGKGKVECHGRRQVLLGVLINDEGYPFKWDVFPGNTAEVTTLKKNILACQRRYKLAGSDVTLVFDRGIISDDNAQMIGDANMKYISALDRNQIPKSGIDLEPFGRLIDDDKHPVPDGFTAYDEQLYFSDAGVVDDKRLVVGFNPALFREDRKNRKEKIQFFESFVKAENKALSQAKRNRTKEATENRIVNELKRLKIRKYFESPILHPTTVTTPLKNGSTKTVNRFRVEIRKKKDVLDTEKRLDGVCVFISNHTESRGNGFKLSAEKIIAAYRNKTKIEDVFKNLKSFLKLRPFFVNTESHVEAVYTICILAYFLNRFLANLRKQTGEKDFLNSRELYAPFKNIDYISLVDKATGVCVEKIVDIPCKARKILERIGMGYLANTDKVSVSNPL